MKLTLLPLQNDDILRVQCEGTVSRRDQDDPLRDLLGPQCYTHQVVLNLERAQGIDTGGVSWLVVTQKRFTEASGRLVLCEVPPVVHDVLKFLRLPPSLCIAAGEQDACELARSPGGARPPAEGDGNRAIRIRH
jgi:anti-anti-sigma regulatory factor